ncbi:unnamed protein product [Rotaria sp. Silwood1]|nr:unnamed protein product [Rotaria sp. Silwood1]
MSIIPYSSLWNKLLNTDEFDNRIFHFVIFRQTTDDDANAQQNVTYLSYFVHIPNITELEFASEFCIYQCKSIQFILQACPNVTGVRIRFKQIKMIKSITEKFYFPSNFALKLVQRFPSLIDIELQVTILI